MVTTCWCSSTPIIVRKGVYFKCYEIALLCVFSFFFLVFLCLCCFTISDWGQSCILLCVLDIFSQIYFSLINSVFSGPSCWATWFFQTNWYYSQNFKILKGFSPIHSLEDSEVLRGQCLYRSDHSHQHWVSWDFPITRALLLWFDSCPCHISLYGICVRIVLRLK